MDPEELPQARGRIHRRRHCAAGPPHGPRGAIVSGGKGTAAAKIEAFKKAGIGIAATPSEMADTLLKMM